MFDFFCARNIRSGIRLLLLLCWVPAFAQVQFGNLQMRASGTAEAGYDGQNIDGTGQGSSHDVGVGGNGILSGFYYNPNFLSFQALPYYNRAQSSADSSNITNSSGYNLSSRIFGGSSAPGSVSFGQGWGNDGVYGLPGLPGLTTSNNSRNFNVSWLFLQPYVPNLAVTFSDSTSGATVIGSNDSTNSTSRSYSVGTSGYKVAGFRLALGYQHQHLTSESDLLR